MDRDVADQQPGGTKSTATAPTQQDISTTVRVWTVRELLQEKLQIPDYQRPYTWAWPQVEDLVDDIENFTTSGRYRLGTVILHTHGATHEPGEPTLDIVDGQQRLTTLHLLIRVLREQRAGLDEASAGPQSLSSEAEVARLPLGSAGARQSAQQVLENRDHLRTLLSAWPTQKMDEFTRALLDECEVVVLQLADLDEAFQMFDSQNSRGRALYPTDLLKAFHLRELGDDQQSRASVRELVRLWEDIPPRHVHALFNNYLFPVKQWSLGRGVPTKRFTTDNIGHFKGIREGDARNSQNRWAHAFMYAKNFTQNFASENSSLIRFGALQSLTYPYQIDQPVLNGETFFRMVDHYYREGQQLDLAALRTDDPVRSEGGVLSRSKEFQKLDDRTMRGREDSRYDYIRLMVDCLVLYYTDRFGGQRADEFARLAARYVLVPRATLHAVRWESVSNHAAGRPVDRGDPTQGERIGLFQHIRDAQSPREVLNYVVHRPRMYEGSRGINTGDEALVQLYWPAEAHEVAS